MEERIHYLERRIEELLVRVSELEKQSAPAVTDADERFYFLRDQISNIIAKISYLELEIQKLNEE